jgi:hypothetical protein
MHPFELPEFHMPHPARPNPHLDAARARAKAWAGETCMLDSDDNADGSANWDERGFDAREGERSRRPLRPTARRGRGALQRPAVDYALQGEINHGVPAIGQYARDNHGVPPSADTRVTCRRRASRPAKGIGTSAARLATPRRVVAAAQ